MAREGVVIVAIPKPKKNLNWCGNERILTKETKVYLKICSYIKCKKEFVTDRKDQICCDNYCKGKMSALKRKYYGHQEFEGKNLTKINRAKAVEALSRIKNA